LFINDCVSNVVPFGLPPILLLVASCVGADVVVVDANSEVGVLLGLTVDGSDDVVTDVSALRTIPSGVKIKPRTKFYIQRN
jgi:hypothetical protein